MVFKLSRWPIVLLVFFIFFSRSAHAQRPDAATLKSKYKDDKCVIVEAVSELSFGMEEDKKIRRYEVKGRLNANNKVMSITQESVSFQDSEGFDNTSEVSDFRAFNNYGVNISRYCVTNISNHSGDGIFYSDDKAYTFAIPMEKQGTEISYEYEKKYNDIKYLTTIYFHENHPVLNKTIRLHIPSWLEVELIKKNFDGFDIEWQEIANSKTGIKTIEFRAKNLNGYKTENHCPGPSYIYPHLLLVFKSFTDKKGNKEVLFNEIDDMYKWFNTLTRQMDNKREVLKELVSKLIADKKTDQQKIEALYYWVQDNIRYIAFEDGIAAFKPADCQTVYTNKYGDCKGMANLLKEMLVLAGFDARLTWIGTNRISYDVLYPNIAIFNHMICTVILNGEKVYLDPTETYISYGDLAQRIQGKNVIIENGEAYIADQTPSYRKERNRITVESSVSLEKNLLKGSKTETYEGEGKTQILRDYNYLKTDRKEDALKSFISGKDKNLTLSNVRASDLQERKAPLVLNYDFSLANNVIELEKEKFISLDYSKEFIRFTFDTTRAFDYEFGYKYYLVTNINFKIPEGYKVKHLPKAYVKSHPDFDISVSYRQAGNIVSYHKEISFGNGIIRKKDFKEWNETVKELKKVYNDQLIIEQ